MSSVEMQKVILSEHGVKETCIHAIFEQQASSTPKAIAVTYGEESLTYAELNRRANQVARRLLECGVGMESLVALLTERSLAMVVGILGILKAGAAYVPLDPAYPSERREFMLADSRASALLTQEQFKDNCGQYTGRVLFLDGPWPHTADRDINLNITVDPANPAYVIYTSGSTGHPKGVLVTHGNVLRLLSETQPWFQFNQNDVWTMFHSSGFDFSVWEMWGALLFGGRLVVVPYWVSRSAEDFLELLLREKVTILNQTPSAFQQLMIADENRKPGGELPLRFVIFGGEALDFQPLRNWFNRYSEDRPRLVNMYGITETTVHVTYRPVSYTDTETAPGSMIGEVIPDLQVYVLDARMMPVSPGLEGEMYVGGRGVARVYLNQPALTAQRFVPNPFSKIPGDRLYRTGDRAKYVNGELEYLGRVDRQVKIRGFRIEPGEIEAVLNQYEGVRQSVVLAEEIGEEKKLVAYVVAGKDVTRTQLRLHLKDRLPEYMVPASLVLRDQMPLTENGKVDRHRLIAEAANEQESRCQATQEQPFVAPRNPLEQAVVEIWARILGVERLGILDNFFDLGGHSLLAMQMTSSVREFFGIKVGLKDIFESPTPAAFAMTISSRLRSREKTSRHVLIRRNAQQAPLAFGQRTGWFMSHVLPENALTMPLAHRLKGKIDLAVLEKSVNEIVQRHDALRARFVEMGEGEPVQRIEPELPIHIEVEDLTHIAEDQREEMLQRRVQEEGRRGFDIQQVPLLRARLFLYGPEDQVLLVVLHHIIGDGWSMKIFYRELEALYGAYRAGRPPSLPDLPIQYSDYALWQRERLESGELQQQLEYWRHQLAGATNLELPTDYPRPDILTHIGVNQRFDLGPEITAGLRVLSHRSGATLHMTLLAIYGLLLHQYSGEKVILVGVPIAIRPHEKLSNVIGFFLNLVVMRIDLRGEPTFSELLQRVKNTAVAAYGQSEAPLELVLQQVGARPKLNRTPLCQFMFNLIHEGDQAMNLADMDSTPLKINDGAAKFDLTLEIHEEGPGLHVRLLHSPELYAESTIDGIRRRFEHLLREVPGKQDSPISEFGMSDDGAPATGYAPSMDDFEHGFLL